MKQLVPWEAVGEGRAVVTTKLDAVGRGPCMKFLQITFIDEICGRVSEYIHIFFFQDIYSTDTHKKIHSLSFYIYSLFISRLRVGVLTTSKYTCYTQRVREKVPSTFPCPECVQ